MTSIILSEKKQLTIWSDTSGQSSSCIVIWDTYIKWLIISTDWLRPTQISNFLQYHNSICPNLSCLDILMIRWWWTNNQWCNLTLYGRFWVTKMCLRVSKIYKICLFGCATERATFWKENFKNYFKYVLIKWYQILYSMSNIGWIILCFVSGKGSAVCSFLSRSCHIMLESHISSSD